MSYTDRLLIDTSSANTWLGAAKPYAKGRTSVNLYQRVVIPSGNSVMNGDVYSDTVIFDGNIRITEQSIGVARAPNIPNVKGADGIMGLGPVALTQGTVTNQPMTTIPTVTQNLYTQGTISQELFSLSFQPMGTNAITFGALTFGAIDPRYTGAIGWT